MIGVRTVSKNHPATLRPNISSAVLAHRVENELDRRSGGSISSLTDFYPHALVCSFNANSANRIYRTNLINSKLKQKLLLKDAFFVEPIWFQCDEIRRYVLVWRWRMTCAVLEDIYDSQNVFVTHSKSLEEIKIVNV